ncbi:hypothetical protein M9H77_00990 [Catharanthus roseus]|uniref:Uncharacterized protein n=1 Tax=Catharanthus roseus TaxID=4058 RepID=A0ACC0C493_CATRO|nr:hypothetical protein M9H77_00990 [Catharanthus roseus]
MNTLTTTSADDLVEGNVGWNSDSDSVADDSSDYYQPISADAGEGGLEFTRGENSDSDGDDDDDNLHHSLPNGYASCMENGVLSLDLSDEDDIEEDDEEERIMEESDMAIQRAFREDETRRNAPLTPENSMRVIEAMRGISFGGLAPDWAAQIPEDQWINQLRNLRRPSPATSGVHD